MEQEQNSSYDEEQIIIKNLDTGQAQKTQTLNSQICSLIIKDKAWKTYFKSIETIANKLQQLILKKQHNNLVKMLTQYPVDLSNIRYLDGWTLLHFAVNQNDHISVDILLRFGLHIDCQTKQMMRTALHDASFDNKITLVQLLIGWGADPNITDTDRNTAMHFAVDYGHLEVVKSILASSKHVDLTIRNNMNMTPFNTCRNSDIFQILIAYSQKVSKSILTESITKTFETKDSPKQQKQIYQSRLIVRNSHAIPNISRVDQVQKFLSLRQAPDKKNTVNNSESVISQQSLEENQILIKQTPKKQKVKKLGSYLKSSNVKNSFRIASQNIGLMREDIFKTHLQNQQNIESYQKLKKLGSGSFAEVYLVRKKKTSNFLALKQISKHQIAIQKLRKYINSQRFVLTQIKHPFILQAHFCLQNFSYLYLITDFCSGGDLQHVVRQKQLSQDIAKIYVCQAALGLQQLHKNKILYRDLKTANALLDSQGHLRLADFGLSKNAENSDSFLGSVNYLAPQMLVKGEKKAHNKALDWYLLGVFGYELVHGYPPFYGQSIQQFNEKASKHELQFKQGLSEQYVNTITKLLCVKIQDRLVGLDKLKEQEWLKDIQWNKVIDKKYKVYEPKVDLKQLRKKEYIEETIDHSIDQKIQWYQNWNYPQKLNKTE